MVFPERIYLDKSLDGSDDRVEYIRGDVVETIRQRARSAEQRAAKAEAGVERLLKERDAFREVAIEWFNEEGPMPENLADQDVIVNVEVMAAEAKADAQKREGNADRH